MLSMRVGPVRSGVLPMRESGNGQPKPHTEVTFDLSVEENTRMQLGEPRICNRPTRNPNLSGFPCGQPVRWLPIVEGTGAISCSAHGEIPFSDTLPRTENLALRYL